MNKFLIVLTGIGKYFGLCFLRVLSYGPLNLRYLLLNLLSIFVFFCSAKKRNAVQKNLTLILERKPLCKDILKVFTEYGKYWAEFFDINRVWTDSERIIDNQDFPPKMKAFLGLTFHMGNFEVFGPAIFHATGGCFNVIAERLQPGFLSNFFKKHRSNHYISTIYHDEKRKMINILNEGGALGVVCDRVVGGKGIETRLFGKKVRLPLNVVSLALQRNIPIVISYCAKEGNALKIYYKMIPANLDFDRAIAFIVNELETAIRKYPFQWHVLSQI